MLTQDMYMKLIEKELNYEKLLLEGLIAGNAAKGILDRVQKRIQLIQDELSGKGPEEEVPEPNTEKPISKENVEPVPERKVTKVQEAKESEYVPSLSIVVPMPTIDTSKVDMDAFNTTKQRLGQYEAAIMFLQEVRNIFVNSAILKQNGENKLRVALMKNYDRLKKALHSVSQGNRIDTFSLPLPIGPQHLIGYSEEERIEGSLYNYHPSYRLQQAFN
eukprot:TRINITY_DN136041_c0_g1_i1.p1 TRINITY_DN136041_c0_g1~~TRINITY_DN136041_c0_g1_i1.p1  ORF type:complete len:218 (+),score=29.70 TRINITY_DN136041_c0_g1_i1:588-1241(+)